LSRWKHRLTTDIVVIILLAGMYQKMVHLGWLRHTILLFFGIFGVLCGALGFVVKPNERFAEFTGYDAPKSARIIRLSVSIFLGFALLACAAFFPRISN
jgi:hypothetical protein